MIKMEVIKIPTLFDERILTRVIENTLNETALAIKIDFEVTQRTWDNKHEFRVRKTKSYEREISTESLIYHFVDAGTKSHSIRPVNAQKLRFQTSYKPKTLVRKILSRQGGASGPVVFANAVKHPGTEARNFAEEIADKWGKELPDQMQRAIDSEV